MPSNDNRNLNVGRQTEASGARGANKPGAVENDDQAPFNSKPSVAPPRDTRDSPAPNPEGCTEGTAPLTPKPLRDPSAKRGSDAPRQAGVAPRPTGKID
jgi:hypothetical protein